jgi:hypothetical protein
MRSTGLELQTVPANSTGFMHGGGGAAPSGRPRGLCLRGELAAGPGAGVLISQEDWTTGSVPPLRCPLRIACCSSPAETTHPAYGPLLEALRSYLESGWYVLILPWVVGVRGMIDVKSVSKILDFLKSLRGCMQKSWKIAIESVKALYSLHKISYQAFNLNMSRARIGSSKAASSTDKQDDSMAPSTQTTP